MNLVFDFGGVVFQWRPQALLQRVLPAHAFDEASAHALAERFFEAYGGDWGLFDRGVIEVPDLARRTALRTGLTEAEVLAVIDSVPTELAPLPEMVDWIERLKARSQPLYFLSNMPAPYAEHLERNHAFLKAFRGGLFSSRVQLIKPEPAIYRLAEERFGLQPAQTVFIDDMASNVAAARAVGWHAIHFKTAQQCEAELSVLLSTSLA